MTLSVARKILESQKTNLLNPNELDIIDISTNEETERLTVSLTGLKGVISNGVIIVYNSLNITTFEAGTGAYPFNRSNLFDTFFHLCLHQATLESDKTINSNPDANHFVSVSIATVNEASPNPLTVDISITDYPLILTYQSNGGLKTEAKPYLGL